MLIVVIMTLWEFSALGHSGSKKCVLGFKYDVKPGKNVSRGMIGFVQNNGLKANAMSAAI